MAKFDKPFNRRSGSLWSIVTAVLVIGVLYFMFFSSRDGEAPSATPGGAVTTGATPAASAN